MSEDRRIRLEKLIKDNKRKQAKDQLVSDLLKYKNIDITDRNFTDFSLSEEMHKRVYELIKTNDIKIISFPFNEEMLIMKLNFIFEYFNNFDKDIVFFYPAVFGFYFRRSNQFYLNHPIAIELRLDEAKEIIMKLLFEMHDDLIVISKDFMFGFVISEDEYSKVTIEYWVK
ncbi:hypothetical protein [Paenibacillus hexagrammi]|uniref:Uncharacterized protein n=1 Tax=Paenibacillus hexagrammi TaxID=2908839 RepID=A0ABY3SQJ0_9BACL|nr:hypothetical protein [Paenibacillus sp. YPD9-1]UJF35514.1 hypothetical protein L0M14_10655 [Paenibacillus sp. YPD9-1]